jgi:cation diffusion facilitator family transporter
MQIAQANYQFQKWTVAVAIGLFILKLVAWYMTNSVAVLTDALESTVNVVSSLLGLYALYLSALPKDRNHPYGHGKVEFLSAGVEGTLVAIAGVFILMEAVQNILHPHPIGQLDTGLILISITGLINFLFGNAAIKRGTATNSLALVATGHHLQSDTWSTLGIVIGLLLMQYTGLSWIDPAVAIFFACFILYKGIGIVRSSLAGIMDEADETLLQDLVQTLGKVRRPNWIDIHNLRIIKYGASLHLDCHLTVPWYFNIHEGHNEIDKLAAVVQEKFGDRIELFVHTDGCLDFSCSICTKTDCTVRKHPCTESIIWTLDNLQENTKHGKPMDSA